MTAHSLRLRLLVLAALLVAMAVLLAGFALVLMFGSHLERRVAADLDANLSRAVALIAPDAEVPGLRAPLADPRYALPLSGLYWQLEDLATGRFARSESLVDAVLVPPADNQGLVHFRGPANQMLVAVSRDVQFPVNGAQRRYRVTVAEDRTVIDQAIAAFRRETALAMLALGLALTLVGWLQVYLGLRPLEALRSRLEAMRVGSDERLLGDFPTEVQPLVREVNDLLEIRDRSLAFARARAADLAHGLKTPLAVLAATASRLRDRGDLDAAGTLDTLSREMAERIDYQLRLARLRLRPDSHVMKTSLKSAVMRIASVLQKTDAGERLHWRFRLDPDVGVNLDQQDLIELVGVVLENACQWAESEVAVTARRLDGSVELLVEDDGPGLLPDQIAALGPRGQRLDEGRKGTGFGMAIAGEILALNKGSMDLGRSPLGGLAARLVLPVSSPSSASAAG